MLKDLTVRDVTLMAFYVALFVVLDMLANVLPLLKMPNGGNLGLSTLPLMLASYQLGWRKGLGVAVFCVLLMFLTGPMYTPDLLGFLLDYLLSFGAYGLVCLLPNAGWFCPGVLAANGFRFVCSTVSGVVVWYVPWLASMAYQAAYLIPTTLLGLVLVPILLKTLKIKSHT